MEIKKTRRENVFYVFSIIKYIFFFYLLIASLTSGPSYKSGYLLTSFKKKSCFFEADTKSILNLMDFARAWASDLWLRAMDVFS